MTQMKMLIAPNLQLRRATSVDLDALIELENASFGDDRLSRRGYRQLLTRPSALLLVVGLQDNLVGSCLLLFNRATSIARLYSLVVASHSRGKGVARALLRAAESAALERECALLRLEVRIDNVAALGLYESEGFVQVEHLRNYYTDGTAALRLERSLWDEQRDEQLHEPREYAYYAQTLDFTCGPAALMMAMSALCSDLRLDRQLEIRLWREATTVFMNSGHGGCGPFGLALAAHNRGFAVTVHAPVHSPMFLDGVRDPDKKKVLALVEQDFVDELASREVVVRRGPFRSETIAAHLRRGDVPVVLISLYRLHGEKGPHWVTVVGYDGHVFRVLDPMSPPRGSRPPQISIARREFERMSRYGRQREAAAVILSNSTRTGA